MLDEININDGFRTLPASDAHLSTTNGPKDLTYDEFERTKAVEDMNIKKVEVRQRTLLKMRSKIESLTTISFPVSDIFMAISTLSLGGIIGAVSSKLPATDLFGQVFYLLASVLFVGFGVAYFFTKFLENQKPRISGEELKELISDILGADEEEER
ncbi:MAG: hypothetical protein HY808_15085 [Nitrospirae bacterium]|nr:hypothetical protein [Nitrospirota bacterium]